MTYDDGVERLDFGAYGVLLDLCVASSHRRQ